MLAFTALITAKTHHHQNPPQTTTITKLHHKSLQYLELTFSGNTGLLKSVHNVEKGIKVQATQHVLSYEPMAQMGANSGAYVFHPTGEAYYVNKDSVTSTVVMGELVQEVHQRFSQTASLVVRLYKGARHFESEWTVSPFESKYLFYVCFCSFCCLVLCCIDDSFTAVVCDVDNADYWQ